jgi:SAM-dependent methyltransferase
MNEGELRYVQQQLQRAPRRILEIGPDPRLETANAFRTAFQTDVTALTKWELAPEPVYGVSLVQGDAAYMPFRTGEFDLVIGYCILEHVVEMEQMLREIKRVLSDDGMFHLTGGGLWSSAIGHHLHVNHHGVLYHFSDENCLVPDWGHLIYNEAGFRSVVRQATDCLEVEDVQGLIDKVVHQVVFSDLLNRMFCDDIKQMVHDNLNVEHTLSRGKDSVPDHIRDQLGEGDWRTNWISFWGSK